MSLKCLSARFVIDMTMGGRTEDGDPVRGLKCLSARFVIDIDTVEVEAEVRERTSQMPFG